MERKRYLELCQRNSVYPKTEIVRYNGAEYYPDKLVVWFNSGITQNTARMIAVVGTSAMECRLSEVEE